MYIGKGLRQKILLYLCYSGVIVICGITGVELKRYSKRRSSLGPEEPFYLLRFRTCPLCVLLRLYRVQLFIVWWVSYYCRTVFLCSWLNFPRVSGLDPVGFIVLFIPMGVKWLSKLQSLSESSVIFCHKTHNGDLTRNTIIVSLPCVHRGPGYGPYIFIIGNCRSSFSNIG